MTALLPAPAVLALAPKPCSLPIRLSSLADGA